MYRKLYRGWSPDITEGAVPGDYLLMGEPIDDNTTEDWNDNLSADQLGDAFPYDYATPPWGAELTCHQDRLYMSRVASTSESYESGLYKDAAAPYTENLSNILFYSELGAPMYFPVVNQIHIGDSAGVVGHCSWREHLFIFKTNGVWVLTGYDESNYDLEFLDTNGLCAYRAYVSSNYGVMWASHRGIMFYDGSKVMTLASYVDGGLTRPTFADGEYPKMAFVNGRYYVMNGTTDLYWLDPETGLWGSEVMGDIGTAGIQGFQRGDKQSHILTMRKWDSTTSASSEISVLHTEEAFDDFDTAGSSTSNYHAPVELVFAPLIPEPDESIRLVNMWVDGTWGDNAVDADKLILYWSTDGADWTSLGLCPEGFRNLPIPQTAKGVPIYLRLNAAYCEDLFLRGIKLNVVRSTRRGTEIDES